MRKKLENKKGFTLAELLIVVAIISVLVAIAIPVFSRNLEQSREAADLANIRAAYAEAVTEYLSNGSNQLVSKTVENIQQRTNGWIIDAKLYTRVDGKESVIEIDGMDYRDRAIVTVKATGAVTVSRQTKE